MAVHSSAATSATSRPGDQIECSGKDAESVIAEDKQDLLMDKRATGVGQQATSVDPSTQRNKRFSRRQKVFLGGCFIANVASIFLAIAMPLAFFTEEVLSSFPTQGIDRHLVVGIAFSSTTLMEALVAPVIAADLHNAGAVNVLVLSSFLISGAVLLFGFLNQIKTWSAFATLAISLRTLQGIGSGANVTTTYALFVYTFPESTGMVNGVMRSVTGFAFAVAPVFGGALYDAGGFGLPYFVMAGTLGTTTLLNILLLLLVGNDVDPADDNHSKQTQSRRGKGEVTFKYILSVPWVWMCLMLLSMCGILAGMFEATISPYMKDSFGTSSSQGGAAILLFALLFSAASLFCGYAMDKWISPRNMCVFGLCMAVLSFLLYGPASILPIRPSVALAYISGIPVGVAAGTMQTAAPEDMLRTLLRRNVGDTFVVSAYVGAITQGVVSLVYTPGLLLGPVLVAVVGLRRLSSLMLAVYVALSLIFLVGYLKKRKSERQQDETRDDTHHNNTCDPAVNVTEQTEMIPLVTADQHKAQVK
ncbi:vesicular acetylcholine transporter-like [Sycon ciliatum]|uniref:vesicular acetylcholine transporter-like n=1 Tax=Sycon ciliatum TaxID=27933 RepID=UPI0031F608B1